MRRGFIVLTAWTAVGLGLAAPAFAEGTLVATGNATAIGQTTADLNGAVYREQVGARWLFEYSPSANFDGTVLSTPAVTTNGKLSAVERKVSGLDAATTYYWRIIVVNRVGTRTVQTFGKTQQFETAAVSSTTTTSSTTTPAPAGASRRHRR